VQKNCIVFSILMFCIRDCVLSTFKTEITNFTADNLVIDYNAVLSDISIAEAK
jgi:hypothetical protein